MVLYILVGVKIEHEDARYTIVQVTKEKVAHFLAKDSHLEKKRPAM